MFLKMILLVSFLFFFFFFLFVGFSFFMVSSNIFKFYSFWFFSLDIDMSLEVFIFNLMVCLVTIFVLFYSEFYLEWYDVKKYFFLIVFFFFSMIFLVHSGGFLTFIVSWDFLGFFSVMLVMFFPNFISFSNSIITMSYNRLGDLFLIISMCFVLFNGNFFFWSCDYFWFYFFIFLCSLTKSAQFPFSLWLPLAMSAPTPISSMVHSSTLVTAGVFINIKVTFFFNLFFPLVIFTFSFLMGGLLACLEMDFKKIIAFSTLSQISMVMIFSAFCFKFFCLIHMFFHALFKSFLFGCSGLYFGVNFMDQNKFKLFSNLSFDSIKMMIFFCVFSMSGLIFSLSFFSKDLLIEWVFSDFGSIDFVFVLLIGSIFTLVYCSFLIDILLNFSFFYFFKFYKVFNLKVYFIYMIFILFFFFSL